MVHVLPTRVVAQQSDKKTTTLSDLPNEVLQDILVQSGNCNLLETSHAFRERLDYPHLRPQIIKFMFNHNRLSKKLHANRALQTRACDVVNLTALLRQPWAAACVASIPETEFQRWVGSTPHVCRSLIQGPWTQALGDVLIRAINTNHVFTAVLDAKSVGKGLMAALRECCVPAVIMLGDFKQNTWIAWDKDPVLRYTHQHQSELEDLLRYRSLQFRAPAHRMERRRPSVASIPCYDFGTEHAVRGITYPDMHPWTNLSRGGWRVNWGFVTLTSDHVRYCMRNVDRNPVLYEFVIREAVNRWCDNVPGCVADLNAYVTSKEHLVEIIAWTLDPANTSEGLSLLTGWKMQVFFGLVLYKKWMPFERADLRYMRSDDVCSILGGAWGLLM